ncbi:hypothetical protein BBF96_05965 [Anoxybacter fermentans]|uniref:Rqc2 homolog RqcH n=1 Tax=Anoxybacter fermentans TaxID=1323375 RepID=A0A3Q9HQ95_9FIRM|nr:NFACT RNA binding domain-containing protein [Anoxybacter fermentans]AZR72978.1 hypothetical protein BBF96_05965 [Anoxybacter fermentans]
MAFDGLVLYTFVEEMKEKLITARVDKIYQPDPYLITITLRGRGKNLNLLLSADPQYAMAHFTNEKFINPPHPPAFCMLLRKYLIGGRIIEIDQPGFERILTITIQNRNEDGKIVKYRLIAELMGRHSNIILLSEDNTILDGIKRIPSSISRHREVLPGRPYIAPPAQDKANPLMAEESSFKALIQLEPDVKLFKAIMNNYRGISPLIAKEMVIRADFELNVRVKDLNPADLDQIWHSFNRFFTDLKEGNTSPTLIEDKSGNIVAYSCFPLKQYQKMVEKSFPTMSQLLDYYFENKIKKQRLNQLSSDLKRTIDNLLKKDLKKYDKLIDQLNKAQNADDYRIKGELITANMHQIKKGMKEFTSINYYDPELKEITIELDPALSPQSNAQKYFKRYNKLKNSIKYIKKELASLKDEIEYLKNVELSLEQIESKLDLEEIREELIEEGYIKKPPKKATPNQHQLKNKPMKFKSSDGFDILVGRNNRQNDRLTKKIASREDLWFHVKEIPGSHVVIRNHDRRDIPERTLLEAATLAAYFSKARESTNVPVDYTQIKYVNKPKGAKPGMVFYENYKTIIVNPDEKLVEKLRIT